MTLHARLTTLLEGHVLARVDRHAWWYSCRADCTTVEGSFGGHLASVLLSAVGVAVVELPEPDDSEPDGLVWFSDSSTPGTVGVYPGSRVVWDVWEWTAEQATEVARQWLGAAALAAADVAEVK